MLLLLHALIPCLGAYNVLPSSSVLLHINIVPSFPVLLHIYTTLVSLLFGTVIPTSFNVHCASQKETDLCKNEDKYLSNFKLCLFTEEDVGEIGF